MHCGTCLAASNTSGMIVYNVGIMPSQPSALYVAAPAVLAQLTNVTLVGVVGPSGVGKTTLIDQARAQNPSLHLVISETSRQPRPGEQDGVDYHFRTREYMLKRIARHEYVQLPPQVTSDFYATAPESYSQSGVSILAIWADAIADFRKLPFKAMRTVFIMPPNYAVWRSRLLGERNALNRRLAEARRSFAFALQDKNTHFIINDDLTTATSDLTTLALGSDMPPHLLADQARGRRLAAQFLSALPSTQELLEKGV